MKEEKRKSTKIINHTLQRNSILKGNHKQGFQTMQLKENVNPNINLYKQSHKIIKRIGSKPTVKAYQTVITESPPEQIKVMKHVQNNPQYQNSEQKSEIHTINTQKYEKYEEHYDKHQEHKKLKRIGKKTFVTAYKQTIIEEQIKKSQKKQRNSKLQNSKKGKKQSQIISNNQQIIEQIQQKMSQNKSKNQVQSLLGNDDILGEDQITQVAMKKVISEQGSFSINVNSAIQSKIQENSVFQKSDRCIETPIKTQSNLGASNSQIIQGQLQKLINQDHQFSFAESNEEEQDQKIKQLIQQIEENFQKNKQATNKKIAQNKNKRTSNQRTSIQRNSSNFLKVPNQRMSNNKSSSQSKTQRESGNSFGFSDISSLQSKNLLQVNKTKQEMQTNSQMGNTAQSFLSEQQKILSLLQEKQKNKSDSKPKNSSKQKQKRQSIKNNQKKSISIVPTTLNNNIQNPIQTETQKLTIDHQPVMDEGSKQFNKYDSILQQIIQTKQDQNKSESTNKNIKALQMEQMVGSIKKPLPPTFPDRLLRSQGPRKLIKQSKTSQKQQKMTQSSIVRVKKSFHTPSNKLNESQTQFNQLKVKTATNEATPNLPRISANKSLHQPTKNPSKTLKRESIANRFGNNKPKILQTKVQQSKPPAVIKRTSKKLQVNKCVIQARKTLHQDSYI